MTRPSTTTIPTTTTRPSDHDDDPGEPDRRPSIAATKEGTMRNDPPCLWKIEGFPHSGWKCLHVIDLNPDDLPSFDVDYATCEVCGQHQIRFVHTLVHDEWDDEIKVGCVCSEKLTGDYVNPKQQEKELKQTAKRRAAGLARWAKMSWNTSAKDNLWTKVKGFHVTVFVSPFSEGFCYTIGGESSEDAFPTKEAAIMASYDRFAHLSQKAKNRRSMTPGRRRRRS
jgi:hypothetical protein